LIGECTWRGPPRVFSVECADAAGYASRKGVLLVFEYRIVKSNTHTGLEKEINKAAADGWEPMFVYAWNTAPNTADHAVLLRRPASGGR
jgi:hypothetical protein